jgi:hypothetical protein
MDECTLCVIIHGDIRWPKRAETGLPNASNYSAVVWICRVTSLTVTNRIMLNNLPINNFIFRKKISHIYAKFCRVVSSINVEIILI